MDQLIAWVQANRIVDYLVVLFLGGLVGIGELVARYRDEPLKAIRSISASVYVIVNAAAAVAALGMIHTFGWFADNTDPSAASLTQVLVAGFGAMAVFRSSLFVVRVGKDDVGVGPVAFLQVILGASDRGVDRKRGVSRATRVISIMRGMTFEEAQALPLMAMALLQNPDEDDAKLLGDRVSELATWNVPDKLKVISLGLATMNVVGESVLEAAADAIRLKEGLAAGVLPLAATRGEGGGPAASSEPTGAVGDTAAGTGLGAGETGEPAGESAATASAALPGATTTTTDTAARRTTGRRRPTD